MEFGRSEVAVVMRRHLDRIRRQVGQGVAAPSGLEDASYFDLLRADLVKRRCDSLHRVINATGIVIHTNLGRAPLPDQAVDAMRDVASGYSSLELDLQSGKRSSRYAHVETLLTRLSGAEAAVVVNNCAAAVMVTLNTFCAGGEVVISRGELIEIGGSFRMPDVIAKSGANMVDVGTTNKTSIDDYAGGVSEQTRALMTSHPSNYRILGFTAKPDLEALVAFAHQKNLLLIHDLGSGALVDLDVADLSGEPTVQACIAAGADLVAFSSDKLLGGPQGGIILGRAELVARIKKNPMLRAMRIDKLCLAALNATLRLYLPPHDPLQEIPVLRMICQSKAQVENRSRQMLDQLNAIGGLTVTLQDDESFAGGGSLPMAAIPSSVIRLRHEGIGAAELARRLRTGRPPVIGRVANDHFLLSLRTVLDRDTEALLSAVGRAAA